MPQPVAASLVLETLLACLEWENKGAISSFSLLGDWFCVKMAFTSLAKEDGSGGEQSQGVELSWIHGETGLWHSVGLRMLAFSQRVPRYGHKKSAVATLWWVRGFNSLYTASLVPIGLFIFMDVVWVCLGWSVLRAEPCTGAALLSSVELCHGEEGRQPCYAFPLCAEIAAPVEVNDGSFLVVPNARQKEAGLHLPQTLNRFLFWFLFFFFES